MPSIKKNNIKKEEQTLEYYSGEEIIKLGAHYSLIIGERSNGKTFWSLEYGLKQYTTKGKQFVYLRRWAEDIRGRRGERLFQNLIDKEKITYYTQGKYNTVKFKSRCYYLSKKDEELQKDITDPTPFCFALALTEQEHEKSSGGFDNVETIIFDEFLSRGIYLQDEFVTFSHVCSTIIRDRDNVKVLMLANTVNKFAPYFSEFGLHNIQKQKQGTIEIYKFGQSKLKIAVEYCKPLNKSKPSDVYFAFNNPKLKMITEGTWELDMYPHLPVKYKPADVLFMFFIEFKENILQCEVINLKNDMFIYIHRKTTPIKNEDDFTFALDARTNYSTFQNILRPQTKVHQKIMYLFKANKVFFQDNETGEIVNNYINACKTL